MAIFSSYIPLLLNVEGGYQALPGDNGNYNSLGQLVGTNYGISAKVYENWIGRPPSVADMKAITKDLSIMIYRSWYWDAIGASFINNQSIANLIVDHAVNAGVYAAGKMTQEVLNEKFGFNLVVDGAIGYNTRQAINSVEPKELHEQIKEARKEHYESIGGEFLKGWLKRLTKFVFSEKKKLCWACGHSLD